MGGRNAEFIETSESESGHAVTLTDGGIAQQLSSLISGEKYTLAFKLVVPSSTSPWEATARP